MRRQQVFVLGLLMSLMLFIKPNHIYRIVTLLKPISTEGDGVVQSEFYLFLAQLCLFFLPIIIPSYTLSNIIPFVGSEFSAWGMAIAFCIIYALFDSSINLWDEVDDITVNADSSLKVATDQRQLYLSLINIVLLLANLRSYLMVQAFTKVEIALLREKAKVKELRELPELEDLRRSLEKAYSVEYEKQNVRERSTEVRRRKIPKRHIVLDSPTKESIHVLKGWSNLIQ